MTAVNNRHQMPFLVSVAANSSSQASNTLITNGSKINVADKYDNTAPHFAVSNPSLLETIISNGGDVNAANKFGFTPLHQAGYETFPTSSTSLLLKAGANVISAEIPLFA